mmetsp:Transcript_22718/g.41303  ORF Transcript_22718/g.41303 Transcript_22718/m.41303 type:complete len:428 (-) Transcript_22718:29-1312(-)
MSSLFTVSDVECLDLARSSLGISTGIGYLDHMLDQFNSHAQVGVAISITANGNDASCDADNHNRHAYFSQQDLQATVGTALGTQLKPLLANVPNGAKSRFCCPLDEALVECVVVKSDGNGSLHEFTLAPYGIYPKGTGRSKIGEMQTQHIETLMGNLATNSGLTISLNRIRGDNGHHVCESAFKALSRALRNLLDGTNTNTESAVMNELWGAGSSESYTQSIQLQRSGKIERKTKETSILVELYLDGGAKGISVETGLSTLNEFWTLLATEANMSLIIQCSGDLWVDDHHTTEDVAIAVGQVLNMALGTKAGLNRMWCAKGTYGDAVVEVTMDLSNRPCLTHNLTFADSGEEYVGGALTVEMMDHALESLVMNGHMTVHIVEEEVGKSVKETAFAAAVAFGKALRYCSAVDPRRAGKTASSKGTLSV